MVNQTITKDMFDFIWDSKERGECKETIERIVKIESESNERYESMKDYFIRGREDLTKSIFDIRDSMQREIEQLYKEINTIQTEDRNELIACIESLKSDVMSRITEIEKKLKIENPENQENKTGFVSMIKRRP